MGEVVVSSEDAANLHEKEAEEKTKEDGTTSSMVRWERFLPKMILRVLLVEADDSTRQIIAALLRKCSYRVAAVPDGLKAWEVLKGKPHDIDLILTEVDLPSISGFALLTLIMEHDVCKNIPVIMMSSNDSVNVVYKCMMRGAADFLVKPVRKNELRNLWQHVWRRQVATRGGNGPHDESVAQQKVEATAENNASSNHSSGYMACVQRNRECIEKGSDAQSSCTKPDLEAERECEENTQDLLQPDQSKSRAGDMQMQKHENHVKSSWNLLMHDCEDRGVAVATSNDATEVNEKDVASENQTDHGNITKEAFDGKLVFVSSSREAIDLIGAFDNYPKCTYVSYGSNCLNKNDSLPLLDLSLKRSNPSGSVNQVSDERHTLNHSDASAFSRYINRAVQPRNSSASICNQQKDCGMTSGRLLSNHALDYNSSAHGSALISQRNILSTAVGQSGQAEVAFPCPQPTVLSVPIPMRTIRFDNLSTAYGSVVPPMLCTQSGPSTLQSPGSSHYQEPSFNAFRPSSLEGTDSQLAHNPIDQNPNNSTSQTEDKQRHKFESSEDQRRISSATDQSATSSFCNGNASNVNTMGSQSNGNADEVVVVQAVAESGNEGLPIHDRTSHRSVQRAAALTKFRLKRKERCYEKKVRYESRKKLAEQRPRVKGQFVRQVQSEAALPETN